MLLVTVETILLNVVMPSVIILSVVAPYQAIILN